VEVLEEAVNVGGHAASTAPLGREMLEGRPVPVADLWLGKTAPGGKQPQHVRLEERGLHAENYRGSRRPKRGHAAPSITSRQEGHTLIGIMHVAGPIFTAG